MQGASNHKPPFPPGELAPPWRGTLHSHGWAPRGEQLFPKGARVVEAIGFPNRLRRARNYSPYSLDTCVPRTFICGGPDHHLPCSPPDHLRKQTAGGPISFFIGLWLAHPFYVSFPPH